MTATTEAQAPSRVEGTNRITDSFDRHVGARIRERRLTQGLTQQQFASKLGITHQQQHKYERGLDRVSAGRLFVMALVLETPVTWFFGDLGATRATTSPTTRQLKSLELLRYFELINDRGQQEAISQMARALAAGSQKMLRLFSKDEANLGKARTKLNGPPAV